MGRKKILFIITQSEFGGAQRFLSTFLPHLEADRYEVLVATGATGDRHFTEHLRNLHTPNTLIPHLVREFNPWQDVRAVAEIRRLIRQFQPDTLFLLSSKAGFLGSLAANVTRYTLHATRPRVIYRIGGWAFNDPQSSLRRWLIIQSERFSARWKDTIIVNNKHDFAQTETLHIKPRMSVELIHNGLDATKLQLFSREEARKKLAIPPDTFIAGTIAHDYPSKGLAYLPPDPKEYRHMVLSNVKNAARYLRAFDVYVSPSVKEGFSWAVLEAMASHVPVIATNVGAMPEVIQDGINGLIIPSRDSGAIRTAVLRLMREKALRSQLAENGYKTALKDFGLDKMVEEVRRLL